MESVARETWGPWRVIQGEKRRRPKAKKRRREIDLIRSVEGENFSDDKMVEIE